MMYRASAPSPARKRVSPALQLQRVMRASSARSCRSSSEWNQRDRLSARRRTGSGHSCGMGRSRRGMVRRRPGLRTGIWGETCRATVSPPRRARAAGGRSGCHDLRARVLQRSIATALSHATTVAAAHRPGTGLRARPPGPVGPVPVDAAPRRPHRPTGPVHRRGRLCRRALD